ncbi:phosphate-starvation-inducible PsiE family protein [[Phormidium] sp. ETS-05]|uniref:phosphate-starvation-inducible PsiE family protein n=1 Tax=[Phormidium] sp. ETS-05 TaxID=222819 RepID=UPI0031FE4A07
MAKTAKKAIPENRDIEKTPKIPQPDYQRREFLHLLETVEIIVSKVLSLAMVVVIGVSIWNLGVFTITSLFTADIKSYYKVLFQVFGLFLNVLIALEILENISGYLKKQVIQVELVIVTSLIAVARKIIILDLDKADGIDIIGLGIAVLALSISYWIVRSQNRKE